MKYLVLMDNKIEMIAEADTPRNAAMRARQRLLGMLREMPSVVVSVGFMPHDTWLVRECDQSEPRRGRPGPIVARGTDEELSPRTFSRRESDSDRAWTVTCDPTEGVWSFSFICHESEDTYPTRESALEGLADFLASDHQRLTAMVDGGADGD